jgi:3'-phosphoadenosine 5'-phosphosulfate sulfotransferase (PAPS reductase)/FAD synthetase
MALDCAYCSDMATGVDEDGEYTCGCTHCTPAVGPLPDVIEISGDGTEDEEGDGTTLYEILSEEDDAA